jgi:hypothetical protein
VSGHGVQQLMSCAHAPPEQYFYPLIGAPRTTGLLLRTSADVCVFTPEVCGVLPAGSAGGTA